jgi:hypothetical protein
MSSSRAWKWLRFFIRGMALWVAYAAAAQSAVAQNRIGVGIDAAFSPQEYDDIRHAIENWNISLANRIYFDIAPGRIPSRTMQGEQGVRQPGMQMLRIRSDHPMLAGPIYKSTLAMALGPISRGFVYVIYDRIPKRGLTGITMHEVGHSLGSGHLEKGLMEPRYSARAQRCIDARTMQAVAAAQRVSFDKLDWCR